MTYSKEEFSNEYKSLCAAAGLEKFIGDSECERLHSVVCRLDECGKKFNLTAITEPDAVLKKHIIDSLFAADFISGQNCRGKSLLDVGSGAGFPSLPIAAVLAKLSVFALDSTAKKVGYMNETAKISKISNFSAFTQRAEEAARSEKRESFDFVTARAVAALPVLCELCIPMLKVGGLFIAMKAAAADEEEAAAKNAARKLGCEIIEKMPYSIPGLEDKRFLLIYRKKTPTPDAYPRNFSQISKKPL